MKIHAISDTHRGHENYEKILSGGDLLVHAGDADCFDERSTESFLRWCIKVSSRYSLGMVITGGNHDRHLAEYPEDARSYLLGSDVQLVLNEFCDLGGFKIFGSPGSILYGDVWTSFAFHDDQLKERYWRKIPGDLDLLVTHSPPKGVLDNSFGSQSLLEAVESTKPKIHIFGHIHGAGGVEANMDTVFINAVSMGLMGSGHLFPMEIIYDKGLREVEKVHRVSLY